MTQPKNLEINIDRLVLEGISPLHRRRLVEAMERELGRLFAGQGLAGTPPARDGRVDLGARAFQISDGLRPEQIGARVARAVWASSRQPVGPDAVGRDAVGRDLAPLGASHETSRGDER